MPPKRRAVKRAHPAKYEEPKQREAEQSEQSETQELRAQMAQMSEAIQCWEEAMEHLMRLFEQRVQPVASPPEHFLAPSSPAVEPVKDFILAYFVKCC